MEKETRVVSIRKKALNARGITDFEEWALMPDSVYIGRNMNFYVKGAHESKWKNPFSVRKYGREKCLEKYRNYILNSPQHMGELEELRGKELGCWCKPDQCHGDILIELMNLTD